MKLKTSIFKMWGAILLLGFFIGLSWELYEGGFANPVDSEILSLFIKSRTPLVNKLSVFITSIGSSQFTILISVISTIILLVAHKKRDALFVIISCMGAGLLSFSLKFLFHRVRPESVSRLVDVNDYSYPSGHTIISVALFLSLFFVSKKYFKKSISSVFLLLSTSILIILVGLSRVYLGVHYPSDVLGSLLLGSGWVWGLYSVFEQQKESKDK